MITITAQQAKIKTEEMIVSHIENQIEEATERGLFCIDIDIPRKKDSLFVEDVVEDLEKLKFKVQLRKGDVGRGCIIRVNWGEE